MGGLRAPIGWAPRAGLRALALRAAVHQHEEQARCHRDVAAELQREAEQHLRQAAEHAEMAATLKRSASDVGDTGEGLPRPSAA